MQKIIQKNERHPPRQGIQFKEKCPFENWQVEFTQRPRTAGNFKYLLLFAAIFWGWVEAFPTQTEKASAIVRLLLKEITPRFGLSNIIQSDNGPGFVSGVG